MTTRKTLNRAAMAASIAGSLCLCAMRATAQTNNYYGTTGALSGNVWSTNPAGPYTSAFSTAGGGGIMNFDNPATQAGGNNTRTVAGINATQNFSITGSPSGTISNEGNLVIPINVAAGATLDFGSQAFTTSATAGYNFTGPGTLALLGGTYGGGFTINSGTLIVRGVNAMGSSGSNSLTINGGTIAANANRNLSGKFPGGISVNGDFTLGGSTGLASATATLTFDNNVDLNGLARTITVGNNAQHTFNTGAGVISNGSLIIDALSGATGRILLLGQNIYAGGTSIKTGATLSTNAISSTGVGPITSGPMGVGPMTLDGGRYIPSSGGSATIANDVILNDFASNTITNSSTGTNVTVMSGNFSGAGGFTKSGSGVLILSGTNDYAGKTIVQEGTLGIAQKSSFYGGVPANWIDTNFTVEAGANIVFAVGGAGEISFTEFMNLTTVGSATGGFKDLASIGIDTTNGGDQTFSTPLTNTNMGQNRLGLVKSGTGTLTLSAANTHGGPTVAAGGTLNLAHLLALQNSTLTTLATGNVVFDAAAGGTNFTAGGLAGSGTLVLQDTLGAAVSLTVGGNNESTTSSAAISGAFGASLTKVGTGTLTLTGANTHDGGTTVTGGRLAVNNASALGTGTLTLNPGVELDNSTGANITVSTGNTQVWNGDFAFIGTRALNLGAGPVTMTSDVTITLPGLNNNNNALTVAGPISGAGRQLTKAGPGRMFLTGQSDFSGGVKILEGPVHILDNSSNLGAGFGPLGTGTLTITGGQLIGSSINAGPITTLENNIDLIGGSDVNTITTNATLYLTGVISGTGGFTRGGNGAIILTNANTFMGDTYTGDPGAGRILNLSNELALQNSTLITASGGAAIDFDGSVASNAFTLGGLSGDRNLPLMNTFSTPIALTIGKNNSSTNHTGILSGDGSLTKIGTGSLSLGGDNTYTGTTTINNGTLLVNGIHTGGGAYTVNSGGTLGGTGVIHSTVNVASGGAVAPGTSIESIDIDSLTLASGTLLNFELGAPGVSDLINVTLPGGFTANGGTFNFTNAGGMASGTYTLINYDGTLGGAFSNLALGMTQPAGFTYLLIDNAVNTSIDLQVTATATPGDFNLDGKVNAADYVLWRKNPGSFPPNAYDTWRANFGNPPGSGAGLDGASVPEPATWTLLLAAAAIRLATRRRRPDC